ncbi:unnamed protein product [Schistosoma curassoni]|uniref:Sulfate_transp domain-containing protein n=1 Tax=Schistosoma curassoni TaxID=6186 RepID=A0A183KFG7_9TREM|nr:unnamed protein product [Schistosoma curassoni]
MFLGFKYADLALPIRSFTSSSDPPCPTMMLPKYVKVFTSSKSSLSVVIGLVHSVLYRRILLFPLCILRPTAAEAAATLIVISCICCCVWDRRARSPAKSRSSSCILDVHCIPFFPSDVDVFMIQSITRRKRKGEIAAASAFSVSAGTLSGPAALPLLICLMTMLISSIVGGPTLIGVSVGAASMFGVFSGAGRFKSSLKCSTHLFRSSSMLMITLPSLLFTSPSGLRRFLESFFVMLYSCPMFPSLAAFSTVVA